MSGFCRTMSCVPKHSLDLVDQPVVKANAERAKEYDNVIIMDKANTDMAIIAATKGMDVAVKTMISEHTDTSGNFNYGAMRMTYG